MYSRKPGTFWLFSLAIISCLFITGTGTASIVSSTTNIFGNGTANDDGVQIGFFTGTMTYQFDNESNGASSTLILTLTNTSPESNGGFLVAFAFNNPENLINAVTLVTLDAPSTWNLLGDGFNNSVPANPFGDFDIGASISESWGGNSGGSGSNSNGIGVGQTVTFTFDFTGTNLDTLDVDDFIQTLSSPNPNKDGEFFAARFRAFDDGRSDKVPGAVPIPGAAWLFGTGLLGLIGLRRKIKR